MRHEIAGDAIVGVVKQDSHEAPRPVQVTTHFRTRAENAAGAAGPSSRHQGSP